MVHGRAASQHCLHAVRWDIDGFCASLDWVQLPDGCGRQWPVTVLRKLTGDFCKINLFTVSPRTRMFDDILLTEWAYCGLMRDGDNKLICMLLHFVPLFGSGSIFMLKRWSAPSHQGPVFHWLVSKIELIVGTATALGQGNVWLVRILRLLITRAVRPCSHY